MQHTRFYCGRTTTPLIVQKQEDLSSNSTTYIVDSCAQDCSYPSTLGQIEGNLSACSMEVSSSETVHREHSSEESSVIGSNPLFSTTNHLSDSESLNYFPIIDFTWSGTITHSFVYFSGSLTLNLDPSTIREGEKIVLFVFNASDGNFGTLTVDSGSCTVTGNTQSTKNELVFVVDSIKCATSLFASSERTQVKFWY